MAHSPGGFLDEESWFHGNISREEAAGVLINEGDEGSFLVRESSTTVGDYAISVLSNAIVHHIQIQKHGEDAFFSVVDTGFIIHGLEELVKYYQSNPCSEGGITLERGIIKGPPPPDTRRHGRTNLLHRATKEGSIEIVQQLVRSRARSLDAKNQDGQTAAHLAAMSGIDNILIILIKAGINVNAVDGSYYTPLHYACINNLPETVNMLLKEGNANPQIRRKDNGWVPMHEAAIRGHVDCVRMLWRHHAPLRPRSLDHELPIHLAIQAKQEEMIRFLDSAKSRKAQSNKDDWYHGTLGREATLEILKLARKASPQYDSFTSFFLIRRHSSKPDTYVLTILWQSQIYKYEITKEVSFFYIDDGPYLDSLEHMVDHYSRWQDGLPCPLMIPVGPTQTFAQPPTERNIPSSSGSNTLLVPPPLPKRTAISCSPNTLHRICNDFANNNMLEERGRALPPFSRDRIPHELVEIGESLGGGEYGEVFQGKLTMGNSGTVVDVAIKMLKTGDDDEDQRGLPVDDFLREAKVMMELEHDNIVRIIGITAGPVYMVQELLILGSLQAFLQEQGEESELIHPETDFKVWAHQIAKGMVYLERKRLVHRDLAARNVLLSQDRIAKISDFGLSRALGGDSDYYTASKGGRWPIKWYAPESCTYGTFSHASDVWSYGITLWEIYSFGLTPYGEEKTGKDVLESVEAGYRLERPKHCPDKIYSILKKCWHQEPDLRPKFTFLENFFRNDNNTNLNIATLPSQKGDVEQNLLDLDSDNNGNPAEGGTTFYSNTLQKQNDLSKSKSSESLELIEWD